METEAALLPKITVKTLTDRVIKIDYAADLTLSQLKEKLVGHTELSVDRQFFLLNGQVYGKDLQEDSLLISKLPGFQSPSEVIAEFNKPVITDENSNSKSSVKTASAKVLDDLLPTLYLFYYEPMALTVDPLDLASDWDQKNRLKFFKGIFAVSRRELREAAGLLQEALPTFTETGFIAFKDLVKYAVVTAAVSFDRPTLKSKIIKSPEVLECINQTPHLNEFITSLYNCRYQEFFQALSALEPVLKADWLLSQHASFIIKEMRIKAYSQMLESYSSLSLAVMANAFGVTQEFMDKELSRFIATGRLNCVIDKVAGVVLTDKSDLRSLQYEQVLKAGDQLLNKIHKLGRVITY